MISINLPKKASLYDIVNKINSLKEKPIGIDSKTEIGETDGIKSIYWELPYQFYWGSAVVYNNEIHILGSYSTPNYHSIWNGSSWRSEITEIIPIQCFIYYLPKSVKIYCDTSILAPDSSSVSLTTITNGYQVAETGNVALIIPDNPTEVQLAHSIVYE